MIENTRPDEHCAPEGANPAATPQPDPVRGGRSCTILVVGDLMENRGVGIDNVIAEVIHDLIARDEMGFNKYGQNLEVNDGRDTLIDWYQEMLDASQYGRKYLEEHPDDEYAESAYKSTITECLRLRAMIDVRTDDPAWVEVETQDEPVGFDHNAVTSFTCSRCGGLVIDSKSCPCRAGGDA